MLLPFGDGQAIGVGPDTADQHRVPVDVQVLRCDRSGYVRASTLDKLHRVLCRYMFEDDLEFRKVAHDPAQMPLDENSFPVEYIDIAVGHFAMNAKHHPDILHSTEHRSEFGNIAHSMSGIGRGIGGIQLCRSQYSAREPVCQIIRIGRIGEVRRHQRGEMRPRLDRAEYPFAIVIGQRGCRYGWRKIGHHDGAGELAGGILGHTFQHSAVTQVNMPIVGTTDRDGIGNDAHGASLSPPSAYLSPMPSTHLARRAIVRVSPQVAEENATTFLQGLLTNDVAGAGPTYAALLSAQGKTMFDLIVWHDGDDVLLDCEADVADDLAKRLSLYRLRRKLDISVDPTIAVHWQLKGAAGQPDPRLPALGHRWLTTIDGSNQLDSGADDTWLAHRLSCGVTEGRAELGEILWLETNAVELNGVSFTKGCYVGQENTARMNWRQKVNRRLIVVPIDRSDEKRQIIAYPELGKAVNHLRIEAISPEWVPAWMDLTPQAG